MPTALTITVLGMSTWKVYLLQFLPRSVSERAPICMNSFLLRAATCMMVIAEAELISPISTVAPSCSSMRWALVAAVAGLTESSDITSSWRPMMPPALLISSSAMRMPSVRIGAERAEKSGQRREMADFDLVGLAVADRRKSECRCAGKGGAGFQYMFVGW